MKPILCAVSVVFALCAAVSSARDLDEFKVKRQQTYEFTKKPVVTRQGDNITVRFTSKAFCDATVAIEDANGKIVRHLASGVLGKNAPAPFKKGSLEQVIVWDGKDDQGTYIDDKDAVTVRVSLGLKPVFERTLFWSPKKRIAPGNRPSFAAAPEGVYVFEGGGVDHIRLFDHQGNYVRTVYPFPPKWSAVPDPSAPDALKKALPGVKGLKWMQFPQDNRWLPMWHGVVQATLFNSGSNIGHKGMSKYGYAASAMAVSRKRLALTMRSLNRVATDGSTGGLPLSGPKTSLPGRPYRGKVSTGVPRSAVFSPDGKWLYMTGYMSGGRYSWLHGVARMDYNSNKPAEVFLGQMLTPGSDDKHFKVPMGVAVDVKGRIYVADYMNSRIQVFTPDGKLFKSVPASKPATIDVNRKTGHMYTASWMIVNRFSKELKKPTLTHYGPVENPKKIATFVLPLVGHHGGVFMNKLRGMQHHVYVDSYTDPATIWVVPGTGDTASKLSQFRRNYTGQWRDSAWSATHYRLYQEKAGKLAEVANFAKDVAKAITWISPPRAPALDRQRMYVDPTDGMLYLAEGDCGVGKAFKKLITIHPQTGKVKTMRLPFSAEEIAFDLNGLIYLRTDTHVARYNRRNWREVPWDYGEERKGPGFDGDGRTLIATLPMPGSGRPGCFHLGGFHVSPKGHVLVSCYNVGKRLKVNITAFRRDFQSGTEYKPRIYPGRVRWGEVHVWDKHGKLVKDDAVRGLPMTDGLAMDKDGNVYALLAANRVLDGKEYPLERSETLIKFKLKGGKIISAGKKAALRLPRGTGPKRPYDLAKGNAGNAWVEGAEWMYGGLGFGGFNSSKGGGGCACWNARFTLDLFARSFATELNRFRVAVLDTNGNLITRIGKYGNVDDGVPLNKAGGPKNPRSVGGDEVALCHPSYVASHTDRRLFIADYGNYRILSVKLDYHATESVALKDVDDKK
jgi:NHL repeat-containing protein